MSSTRSCSASGSDSSSAGAPADASEQQQEGGTAARGDSEVASGDVARPAAKDATSVSPVVSQMLARTAALSLDVKDLEAAAAQVRAIATTAGGLIVSEKLSSRTYGDSGEASTTGLAGTITLQVPGDKLDTVLADLSKVGSVRNRAVSSEDVRSDIVDTESRLKTMRESVARVRALMGQATKLSDIVSLESELSSRQADLEVLEGQLASLKDRVAMSPVTVSLQRTGVVADEEDQQEDNAFVVGLRGGWEAFSGAVAVLLTILGALLPFAIVGGLIGWPVVLWLRKRAAARKEALARPAPPTAAPEPAPEPEPAPTP